MDLPDQQTCHLQTNRWRRCWEQNVGGCRGPSVAGVQKASSWHGAVGWIMLNPLRWWDVFGKVWKSMEKYGKVWKSMEKYGTVWKNPGCWDIAKYLRSPRKKYRRYRRGSWMALDVPVGLVRQLSDAFELSKLTALSLARQNSDGALLRFAWMNWWSSKHRASQVFKPWFHCGKNSEHFVIVGMDFAMMWRSDMEWQWWNMMKHDVLALDLQGQMVTWASRRRKRPWQWQSLPFSGD